MLIIFYYWMDLTLLSSQCQLIQGDIIIVQKRVTEAKATEQIIPYPTAASYLEFVRHRKVVRFKPLKNLKVLVV